jgi:hypothetical protein
LFDYPIPSGEDEELKNWKFIMSEKVAAVRLWTLSGGGDQAAKTQGRIGRCREALIERARMRFAQPKKALSPWGKQLYRSRALRVVALRVRVNETFISCARSRFTVAESLIVVRT